MAVGQAANNALYHIGCKAIIVNSQRQVLLLRRLKTNGHYWEVPGGRMDGSESVQATLARELKEELNFSGQFELGRYLHADKFVDGLDRLKLPGVGIFYVFYELRLDIPNIKLDPHEHVAYQWRALEQIKDPTWLAETGLATIFQTAIQRV